MLYLQAKIKAFYIVFCVIKNAEIWVGQNCSIKNGVTYFR